MSRVSWSTDNETSYFSLQLEISTLINIYLVFHRGRETGRFRSLERASSSWNCPGTCENSCPPQYRHALELPDFSSCDEQEPCVWHRKRVTAEQQGIWDHYRYTKRQCVNNPASYVIPAKQGLKDVCVMTRVACDLKPNISPCGPPTQSISTWCRLNYKIPESVHLK